MGKISHYWLNFGLKQAYLEPASLQPEAKSFLVRYHKSDKKPGAKRHVVSGTLALLYTVFGLKLGCSGAAAPIGDEVL